MGFVDAAGNINARGDVGRLEEVFEFGVAEIGQVADPARAFRPGTGEPGFPGVVDGQVLIFDDQRCGPPLVGGLGHRRVDHQHAAGEPRHLAGGGIFVNDAVFGGTDDFRLRRFESIVRGLPVTASDGFLHLADGGAHARAPDFVDFRFSRNLARGSPSG